MNSQWQAYLSTQSAHVGADNRVQFDAAESFPECSVSDLSSLGLIAIEGVDAVSFLQGQFTNDTRNVRNDRAQLSGFCTAKGRMLANFLLFQRADTLFLQMPQEILEPVLTRLQMFVLRAKVSLRDASDELVRIGLSGECTPALLAEHFPGLPEHADEVLQSGAFTIIRRPGQHPRFEILGRFEGMKELWENLSIQTTPANPWHWAWLDIVAGIPTIFPATTEAFVPQMANMQLINGVSFTKGCYTGQEVVARMQYLGKLKRRMYLTHIDAEQPPKPGDALFAPNSASGQGTGKIVNAQAAPGGGYDALVVVEIDSVEKCQVRLGEDGPTLQFRELPYSFQPEQSSDTA